MPRKVNKPYYIEFLTSLKPANRRKILRIIETIEEEDESQFVETIKKVFVGKDASIRVNYSFCQF